MKYRYRPWPSPDIKDKHIAEKYFEYMAAEGYHLVSIGMKFAKFAKGLPSTVKYSIDFFDGIGIEKNEYLSLCQDSGWDLVCDNQPVYYFRNSECCTSPTPIHTDELTEQEAHKFFDTRCGDIAVVLIALIITIIACFALGFAEAFAVFFLSIRGIALFDIPLLICIPAFVYRYFKLRSLPEEDIGRRCSVIITVKTIVALPIFLMYCNLISFAFDFLLPIPY